MEDYLLILLIEIIMTELFSGNYPEANLPNDVDDIYLDSDAYGPSFWYHCCPVSAKNPDI